MRDDSDPAARPEMLRNGLRVVAATASFQAVEDHEGRGAGCLLKTAPVFVSNPAPCRRCAELRIGPCLRAVGGAIGEQTGPGPVKIQEVAIGSRHAFPDERDAVMADDQRTIKGLRMAARKPRRRQTRRSVDAS